MSQPHAIEVRGLVKKYGNKAAVAGVDLTVEQGEIFALLGPNGAGKTTIVEILEGYRKADSGQVKVLGFDPATKGVLDKDGVIKLELFCNQLMIRQIFQ